MRAVNEDQENVLHICAKQQVKEDLFNIIWKKLPDTYSSKLMAMEDAEENLPLEVAARVGNQYMCKILLDYVKNKSPKSEIHRLLGRAAHEASEAGHLDILKLIISHDFNTKQQQLLSDETEKILQLTDEYGYTCLHLAAARGNIQTSFFFYC